MSQSIFITATSTNIGKTLTAAMLMSAARDQGIKARYFKPIQTGDENDCQTVKKLAQLEDEHLVKPIFSFSLPAAPYQAALAENKQIDTAQIINHFKALPPAAYIVEGAGGLLVPVSREFWIRDLIKELGLSLLIVASTQLGTMNHILLTLEAALAKKIPIKGLILSGASNPDLSVILRQLTPIPILAEIPWLETISAQSVQKAAYEIFDKKLLESIFI